MNLPGDPYGTNSADGRGQLVDAGVGGRGMLAGAGPAGRGVVVGAYDGGDRDRHTRRLCPPTHGQLVYAKELMIVVLLAIAFPWLLSRLLTNPASVLRGAIPVKP